MTQTMPQARARASAGAHAGCCCRELFTGAPTIAARLHGHDNNFNLIRFLAASLVLLDHSLILVGAPHQRELLLGPLTLDFNQVLIGPYAVDAFFIVSGFLVTKSALTRDSVIEFGAARLLRLLPALVLVSLALAFVLGPLITSVSPGAYFSDLRTWLYAPLTAGLVTPRAELPGVFETVPIAHIVNSPVWTLRYEALCYLSLAVLALSGALLSRRILYALSGLFAAYLLVTFGTQWRGESAGIDSLCRFGLDFFVIGGGFYLLRDQIKLSGIILALLALLAAATAATNLAELTFRLALGYAVVWAALVPEGAVRGFNRLGDYSYGVYIWCWPVQQTIVTLLPRLTGAELFALSFPITLILAVLSWHLVEHPALRQKHRAGAAVRGALAGLARLGPVQAPAGQQRPGAGPGPV